MLVCFFLPNASFKMATFSDPQHTHPGIFTLESPPPPSPGFPCYKRPIGYHRSPYLGGLLLVHTGGCVWAFDCMRKSV